MEAVFTTEGLPRKDRWESWYEHVVKAHVGTVKRRREGQDRFSGTLELCDLGAVQISTMTYSPLELERSPKLIRQADPEAYYLSLNLRGVFGMAQGGREAVVNPGDMVLYDTSRPFRGWITSERATARGMIVQVPKRLLHLPPGDLDQLTAVPLPGRKGLGALFARHLIAMRQNTAGCTAADTARLTTITLDLFAAMCASAIEADTSLPTGARHRALSLQIHDYIQQRLHDPGLTPESIAAAHHISLRQLYKIFNDQGLTVAGWIRQLRLQRCRRDLAEPQLRSQPVQAICARWGFTRPADFSRTFRAAYGMPPGAYRELMQHGHATREPSATACSAGPPEQPSRRL
jgi:AraC-like DNA-binding protein